MDNQWTMSGTEALEGRGGCGQPREVARAAQDVGSRRRSWTQKLSEDEEQAAAGNQFCPIPRRTGLCCAARLGGGEEVAKMRRVLAATSKLQAWFTPRWAGRKANERRLEKPH